MKKIILACMIVVPLIPFGMVIAIGYTYFISSLENSTIASMNRIVEDHRHMIESFLDERKADLEFIIQSYSYDYLSRPDNLRIIFGQLKRVSNAFVDLGILSEAGVHLAYQGPYALTGKVYKETDWFAEVKKNGYYISDVFLGFRQVPHFIIAISRKDGDRECVIRATIDTFTFNALVEQVRIGKTGEAYLLNKENILQTNRRSGGNLMEKLSDRIRYPASHHGIQTFINKDSDGKKYLYATTWLKNKDWLLVVRLDQADAFRSLRSAGYLIFLTTVIGGAVIVTLAFFLTNRIIGRMERMDSEKASLSQQLILAARLAEIGEMAAGFAHEINNPLQIMKTEQALIEMIFSELKEKQQLRDSEDLTELEDSLDQIKIQINRCAKITQAILKFARQDKPSHQKVDLETIIPECTGMISKNASVHGIAIDQKISEDLPLVFGDPVQFQQVLLNLYNNAIDAIIEKHGAEGGQLVIEAGVENEQSIEISVMDNGCGINPENQEKIFSPFYTTKPVGKGTGLGLSVCFGIVESMGGVMDVSSEQGVGTTFRIRLPVADPQPAR
ncbi:MAG: ATP-binding protein [Pseudomonadota bacterium]